MYHIETLIIFILVISIQIVPFELYEQDHFYAHLSEHAQVYSISMNSTKFYYVLKLNCTLPNSSTKNVIDEAHETTNSDYDRIHFV